MDIRECEKEIDDVDGDHAFHMSMSDSRSMYGTLETCLVGDAQGL